MRTSKAEYSEYDQSEQRSASHTNCCSEPVFVFTPGFRALKYGCCTNAYASHGRRKTT